MANLASASLVSMPSAVDILAYPVDWICLGTIFVLFTLFALWNGTARIASFSLALGVGTAIYSSLADAALVGPMAMGASSAIQAVIFCAIAAMLYIIINRIIRVQFGESSAPLSAAAAACGATILLAVVWVDVAPLSSLWQFGPQVQGLLAEKYRFWQYMAAYAAVAFARS